MLEIFGWWEFALALGVLALALAELVGLVGARREGLTRNVSRLVTHGLLAALSALYAWTAVWGSGNLAGSEGSVAGARFGIANWGLLVIAGMLLLVLYELVAHTWAMQMGYTRSVPRLVTHVAMATTMALMLMMNLTRWQIYRTGVLEGSTPASTGGRLIQVVGWWELVLIAGVALLAGAEFLGLWAARRAGKTSNRSRLAVYGALTVLAAVYAWIEVSWGRGLAGAGSITIGAGQPAVAEWGLAVLAALLFLALHAVVTVLWARRFGLLSSVARLVINLVLAAFVILVVAINLSRWQMYFSHLEQGYEESIRPGADPR